MHIREREYAFNTIYSTVALQDQPANRPNIQPSVPRASFLLSSLSRPIFLLLSSDSISNANPLGQRHLFSGPLIGANPGSPIRLAFISPIRPVRNRRGLGCRQSLRACGAKWHDRGLRPTRSVTWPRWMGLGAVPLVNLRHSKYECLSIPPPIRRRRATESVV
jgi:hypothetical protein